MKLRCVILLTLIVGAALMQKGAVACEAGRGESSRSCTIFTACSGRKVLLSGNLDHPNLDGYLWFWPRSEDEYGGIMHGYSAEVNGERWIGYENGMNDRGLAFATNGLPDAKMQSHPEKELSWTTDIFWRRLLRRCANVEEAIELAKSFDFGAMMDFQVHVADSSGMTVVISPGSDGEVTFTRKKEEERYLVSTNFNVANPSHGHEPYPCPRYETAVKMLESIEREDDLTLDFLRSILDAVHFEGASYNSIYSYSCDLKRGVLYLWYFHQFDEAVAIDLDEELAKGERTVDIRDLFSERTRLKALEEHNDYRRVQARTALRNKVLISAAFLLLAAVVISTLLAAVRSRLKARRSS